MKRSFGIVVINAGEVGDGPDQGHSGGADSVPPAPILMTKLLGLLLAAFALCASLGCSHKDGPHSVTLTWNPPVGVSVVGYNVYRSTTSGSGFVRLATQIAGPPYEDRLVLSGRTYFYVVTALDKSGQESRFSPQAQASIP